MGPIREAIAEAIKDIVKDLAKDIISVRSMITLGAFFLAYILIYQGKVVPDILRSLIDLLLGYYFGSRITKLTKKSNDSN